MGEEEKKATPIIVGHPLPLFHPHIVLCFILPVYPFICNFSACSRLSVSIVLFWRTSHSVSVSPSEGKQKRATINYGLYSRDTVGYATTNDATTNECYNEQFLLIKSGCYNEHRCYNKRMLKRTLLLIKSRCYNERLLQRAVFINKIRMLQRTQMLQRTNAKTNSFINKIRMLQRTTATTNSFY